MKVSAPPSSRFRPKWRRLARLAFVALAALAPDAARAQDTTRVPATQAPPRLSVPTGVQEPAQEGFPMPSVVGRPLSQAAGMLSQYGLQMAPTGTEPSDQPAGTVLRQSPAPRTPVRRGSVASLVVSSGPRQQGGTQDAGTTGGTTRPPATGERMATVPNLTGMSATAARGVLLVSGLRAGRVEQVASSARPGTVVEQSPAAGARVPRGTAVSIALASESGSGSQAGAKQVPYLGGLSLSEAEMLLEREGFGLGAVDSAASSEAPGLVTAQQPAGYTEARPGTRVAVTLSRREQGVRVPNLAGMPVTRAGSVLREAGLRMGGVDTAAARGDPSLVLRQSVAAGQTVAPGTAVGVTVAAGIVRVPNLAGRTLAEAAVLLRQSRLSRGAVDSAASDRAAGTVARQSPAAGAEVAPGSSVAITLAQAAMVAVPNVVGSTPDAARRAVIAAGLRAGSVDTVTREEPGASVVRQSIAAGTRVRAGTALDLRIAMGTEAQTPTTVAVPDVIGATLPEARGLLAGAGLEAEVDAASADSAGWTVVSQTPVAGRAAVVGTAVRLDLQPPPGPVVSNPSTDPVPDQPPPTGQTGTADPSSGTPAGQGGDGAGDGGFPWIWIVVAAVVVAAGIAVARMLRKPPAEPAPPVAAAPDPVPPAAPVPPPVPVIRTSGSWDPGTATVAVEGRLLGDWEATLGATMDAGVQTVGLVGTLITAEEDA